MQNNLEISPKLTQKQAMQAFPMYSKYWWERKRWSGDGPRYRKQGNRVYYELDDLIEYFESPPLRKSTSEYRELTNEN